MRDIYTYITKKDGVISGSNAFVNIKITFFDRQYLFKNNSLIVFAAVGPNEASPELLILDSNITITDRVLSNNLKLIDSNIFSPIVINFYTTISNLGGEINFKLKYEGSLINEDFNFF